MTPPQPEEADRELEPSPDAGGIPQALTDTEDKSDTEPDTRAGRIPPQRDASEGENVRPLLSSHEVQPSLELEQSMRHPKRESVAANLAACLLTSRSRMPPVSSSPPTETSQTELHQVRVLLAVDATLVMGSDGSILPALLSLLIQTMQRCNFSAEVLQSHSNHTVIT